MTDPKKIADELAAAARFQAQRDFPAAIRAYERVVAADPTELRAQLQLGELHLRLGSKDLSVKAYEQVAKRFAAQGMALKALAVYKQILAIDPTRLETYLATIGLYAALGLSSDARAQVDELTRRVRERPGIGPADAATYRTSSPLVAVLEQLAALGDGVDRGVDPRSHLEIVRRLLTVLPR